MSEITFTKEDLALIAPSLYEYFGFRLDMNAEPHLIYPYDEKLNKLACDLEIITEEDSTDREVYLTLLFVAIIWTQYDLSYISDDGLQEIYNYDAKRRDLLELYLYVNGDWTMKHSLTIKRSDNIVLKLGNYENHLIKELKLICRKLIPEITSIDQAQTELDQLCYVKKGRKQKVDKDYKPLIFGIYRLFDERKNMRSPLSDDLCRFMDSYLDLVGVVVDKDVLSHQRLRTDIDRIARSGKLPKLYDFCDMSFCHDKLTGDCQKISWEDWNT